MTLKEMKEVLAKYEFFLSEEGRDCALANPDTTTSEYVELCSALSQAVKRVEELEQKYDLHKRQTRWLRDNRV
jgi:hypothetical protein